jgi:hypothetical protein
VTSPRKSDGVQDHPGIPFGFIPDSAFGFAGIPTSRHIMETRTLKHTDLTVSRACFGTMTFGSQVDEVAHRVQLTTDGHRVYLNAVIDAFADDIDYAMLVKMFGADHAGEARYSPANCTGCREVSLLGNPNPNNLLQCSQFGGSFSEPQTKLD